MECENSGWEGRSAREKADLLKGNLSYREHYNYLMDWYLKDRKLQIPASDVHESLKDVLEALKELNTRIDASPSKRNAVSAGKGGIFTRLAGWKNA